MNYVIVTCVPVEKQGVGKDIPATQELVSIVFG
jgi:hypothetical protein